MNKQTPWCTQGVLSPRATHGWKKKKRTSLLSTKRRTLLRTFHQSSSPTNSSTTTRRRTHLSTFPGKHTPKTDGYHQSSPRQVLTFRPGQLLLTLSSRSFIIRLDQKESSKNDKIVGDATEDSLRGFPVD